MNSHNFELQHVLRNTFAAAAAANKIKCLRGADSLAIIESSTCQTSVLIPNVFRGKERNLCDLSATVRSNTESIIVLGV